MSTQEQEQVQGQEQSSQQDPQGILEPGEQASMNEPVSV